MVLSIMASIFLLPMIWETSTDNTTDNSRFFDDYDTNFQDFIGRHVISICCSWGEELADEELTFMIREDDDVSNNQDSVSTQNRDSNIIKNEAVYDAIEEWDHRIEGLILREVQSRYDADIEIRFREGESDVAGLTRNFFDRYGLITKSFVTIYDRGFPFAFNNDQIEQIVKHEIGHVLGLGHANFDDSLMATRPHHGSGTISDCEIQAVYEANHWKLRNQGSGTNNHIYHPNIQYLECNSNV
jgi:predicted Zn-dependent protease with MMP-like domain